MEAGTASSQRPKRVRFAPENELESRHSASEHGETDEEGSEDGREGHDAERGEPAESVIDVDDDDEAREPPAEEARSGIVRVGADEPARPSDVKIVKGTLYGNPFVMRGPDEREAVAEAYRALLRTGATAYQVARQHATTRGSLQVDERAGKTAVHVRLEALRRLALRARTERVRVRCTCKRGEVCHGDVIVEWVEARTA